jgi:hypothetical protein
MWGRPGQVRHRPTGRGQGPVVHAVLRCQGRLATGGRALPPDRARSPNRPSRLTEAGPAGRMGPSRRVCAGLHVFIKRDTPTRVRLARCANVEASQGKCVLVHLLTRSTAHGHPAPPGSANPHDRQNTSAPCSPPPSWSPTSHSPARRHQPPARFPRLDRCPRQRPGSSATNAPLYRKAPDPTAAPDGRYHSP